MIRESSEIFDFTRLEASLLKEEFETERCGVEAPSWQLRIPLGESGYINVWCEFGRRHKSGILVPWVEALRAHVPPKLSDICRRREMAPTDIDSLVNLAEEVGGVQGIEPATAAAELLSREQF